MTVCGYMSANLDAQEEQLERPGLNLTETRHDATHLRTKISFYEESRSKQR